MASLLATTSVEVSKVELEAMRIALASNAIETDEWAEMRSLKQRSRQIRLQRESVRREKYFVEELAESEI